MRICMFLYNPFKHDARVLKEATTLVDAGHQVTVVALRDVDRRLPVREVREGVAITRVEHDPLVLQLARGVAARRATRVQPDGYAGTAALVAPSAGGRLLDPARRAHMSVDWQKFALRAVSAGTAAGADVWWAHDLETLPVAALARRRNGGRLVYDAHELYVDRTILTPRPGRLWRPRWTAIERRLIRGVDRAITVSPPIADELARRYRVPRPLVVMNVPSLRRSAAVPPRDIRAALGISSGTPVVLYVGGLKPFRGIEELIRALPTVPAATLVLMGQGSGDYIAGLRGLADAQELSERVRIADPVPSDEVVAWARGADVGVATVRNAGLSYYHALPNKLFEYIHAEVPVVGSDFPAMGTLIERYGVGVTCDPDDPAALSSAVSGLLGDPARMAETRSRARAAAQELNWEREGAKLVALVDEFSGRRAPASPGGAASQPKRSS